MSLFRLVVSGEGRPVPDYTEFPDMETATLAAQVYCVKYGGSVTITQDVATVEMAPVVKSLATQMPPAVLYRDSVETTGIRSQTALELMQAEASDGPKRDPQAKPRLLILDRKATPAELVGHLIVVAEGRIVKNAFGALELGDIPATEQTEVANVLRRV